jgi:hyperosmotically inducible protein
MQTKISAALAATSIALLSVLTVSANDSAKKSATSSKAVEADNTGKNTRDRDGNTLTAGDQAKGTQSDVELTRLIRREIVQVDGFSTNAKNVKIITKNGVVEIRGPVANERERTEIANIASNHVGTQNVRNKLEVARP